MWRLWGVTLSPFALKVEVMLRFAGLPFRRVPAESRFLEALDLWRRRDELVGGWRKLTWPKRDPLDEYPLVPFLFGPNGENLYDSTAIGLWLDGQGHARHSPLLPSLDPAAAFVVQLVDEALDEVGLYVVHHRRWVTSARDNDAGERLAREMRPLLGPFARILARTFPARQVRRLPYLFSVAPENGAFDDLPLRLRPPARPGFPPTHALLDRLGNSLLDALEPILSTQPFLFGPRFTLADASVYGQLGMNRADPSAWQWIGRRAPATQAWVDRLARGDFTGHVNDVPLVVGSVHEPLLAWITTGFVRLMQQNHDAWRLHVATGEKRFNERAFDAGRALYDGTLLGHRFRSVVKTFQVRVWRDLRRAWDALPARDRARVEALLPAGAQLDRDGVASPGMATS